MNKIIISLGTLLLFISCNSSKDSNFTEPLQLISSNLDDTTLTVNFKSSVNGTLKTSGKCPVKELNIASGDNTIQLTDLEPNVYDNCKISLTDQFQAVVSSINIPAFTVTNYLMVSTGSAHTCALTIYGKAYCWGGNNSGQLGVGTVGVDQNLPVLVTSDLVFKFIDATGDSTCALTVDGVAYCWGANFSGRLGNGNTTHQSTPSLVSGGHVFKKISMGQNHGCGIKSTGVLLCWGENSNGQLGVGDTTDRLVPELVIGGLSFKAVSSGKGSYTCGITNDDLGYCWGIGFSGNLGNGIAGNVSAPSAISGGLKFSVISAGGLHTCGVTIDKELYCWGDNSNGQLGNGGTTQSFVPTRIIDFAKFESVTASFNNTCALAISTDDTSLDILTCWGLNDFGQLGVGTTGGFSYAPQSVLGESPTSSITMGNNSVCGIVPPSSINCFGNNIVGKFGNGTSVSSNLPTGVNEPF